MGDALHHHLFTDGGMDKAVRNLMSHWGKDHWGLGYSAGGTVLWKAAARGHAFSGIFCVSSTRLRNEGAIETPHHVFFGNKDPNKPASEWLSTVPKQYTLLNDAGHNYYLDAHSTATELTCKAMARQMSAL
ncbi:MAG TPA: hypothetical protein DCS30_10840 [Rhizobiales bacterium]|nr:hypothetical protein [Hyphomicrobiales bacterium]